jgi:hypothetical protein
MVYTVYSGLARGASNPPVATTTGTTPAKIPADEPADEPVPAK